MEADFDQVEFGRQFLEAEFLRQHLEAYWQLEAYFDQLEAGFYHHFECQLEAYFHQQLEAVFGIDLYEQFEAVFLPDIGLDNFFGMINGLMV